MQNNKTDGAWYPISNISHELSDVMESQQRKEDAYCYIKENSFYSGRSLDSECLLECFIDQYGLSCARNSTYSEIKSIYNAIDRTHNLGIDKVYLSFETFNLIMRCHENIPKLDDKIDNALTMFKQSSHYLPNYEKLSRWEKFKHSLHG